MGIRTYSVSAGSILARTRLGRASITTPRRARPHVADLRLATRSYCLLLLLDWIDSLEGVEKGHTIYFSS